MVQSMGFHGEGWGRILDIGSSIPCHLLPSGWGSRTLNGTKCADVRGPFLIGKLHRFLEDAVAQFVVAGPCFIVNGLLVS